MKEKLKFRNWEIVMLVALFLFSISLFNLAGYIFSAMVTLLFMMEIKNMRISILEVILISFSITYFLIFTYYNAIDIETIILYLFGPWTAFIVGKTFVKKSKNQNAFIIILIVLAAGMCIHGLLNWVATLQSSYMSMYDYQRIAVDFWRKDIISVTVTGMFYTFATGISIGALISNVGKKYKVIAGITLILCISATVFFANKTLLVIIAVLLPIRIIIYLVSRDVPIKSKMIVVLSICLVLLLILIVIYFNIGGIYDQFLSLKIVDRVVSSEGDSRSEVWGTFFEDANWLKYPFGGGSIAETSSFGHLHNLWLDIYNTVGIIPFILFLIFTVCAIKRFVIFRRTMLREGMKNEYICFEYLFFAIILNCMVEPIIEANPYYFLIVLMYIGAMEGQIYRFKFYKELE